MTPASGGGVGDGPLVGSHGLVDEALGGLVVGEHGLGGPFEAEFAQAVLVAQEEHGGEGHGQGEDKRQADGGEDEAALVGLLADGRAVEECRGHGFAGVEEQDLLHDGGGGHACRAEEAGAEEAHERVRGCGG